MRFTEGSGECSDYHGEPRMMYGVEEAIRDAWQKRAARRAWNPPEGRTCGNCENGYNYHRSSPCWKCLRNAAAEHYQFLFLQDNWRQERRLAMINILLSVRRPFSEKILSGEKKWELRKTKPIFRRCGPVTLWFYESGKDGEGAIIGKCQLKYLIRMISYIPDGLIEDACITKERGRSYLPCYAWHIYDPVRLPLAVPLSDIGLTRPPQSWRYITNEQAAILERRGE